MYHHGSVFFCSGAIYTINDGGDYAYNMKRPKLGDAMFDEDDIFCPPSFDEQIYYCESMPPIYDDYFGNVMEHFYDSTGMTILILS